MADDIEAREPADDVQPLTAEEPQEPDSPQVPDETAEETSEPHGPGISEALVGRAEGYGLAQADLEGLDADRLERMFSAIDRRIMQPQAETMPAAAPGMPQLAPTAAATTVPTGDVQYAPLKLEIGDDLDESVVKPFQSVVDHLNTQLKDIHAFRQQAQMEMQAMNVLREFSDFDRFISGLGDEWTKDYGSDLTMDMDPQGVEFKKRLEVFHGARSLQADAARRRQRMSTSDALMRSHRAVHWDRIAGQERRKLDGKIDRRRRGAGERPVKGKQPAMSPRDEAIEAWK